MSENQREKLPRTRASRSGDPAVGRVPPAGGEATRTISWNASRLARQRRTHPASGTRASKRQRVLERVLSVPLAYLSASVVVALAVVMIAGYLLTSQRDAVVVVVVAAIAILANGWSGLVHSPTRFAPALSALIVGVCAVIAVRASGDLAWSLIVIGLSVLVAALLEMARPMPRVDLVQSISASTSAGLVSAMGAAWVALTASPLWSAIMIFAAVLMTVSVIGNQIGSTLRANVIGALACSTLAGALLGLVAIQVDLHAVVVANLLPDYLAFLPPSLGAVIAGACLGIAIALTISLIDALVGEHGRRCTEAGAFARGALKFLLSAVPIYLMVRIGAL